jgi:hypothetical protein
MALDAARESKDASAKALEASTRATKTLTRIERAYLTGGGDIVKCEGGKFFRIDVANYGKTASLLAQRQIIAEAALSPDSRERTSRFD